MPAGAVRVALDTWVVPRWHSGPGGQFLLRSSLVLTGAEPVLVDAPAEERPDAAWSVVDPGDVRWIVIGDGGPDHAGGLAAVLPACPLARVVAAPAVAARLLADLPELGGRLRAVGDGQPLPVRGRALVPLLPAGGALGLADPQAGLLWAGEAFAAPVPGQVLDPDELPDQDWPGAFRAYAAASPWPCAQARPDDLLARWPGHDRPRLVVSAHGPLLHGARLAEAVSTLAAPTPALRAAGAAAPGPG
ncbi:MBL fold metallo-hydrolase [Motilibacter aurantiacus]|uniref:MBL fold metallo-hydrolase n=1 Tax=Motilibacter aurantiacus TaxID=2714955 RepID=UPI00140BE0D6|nr:MBL fold metallo-hydrolase [Motilibacter aurantiacus]NHC43982.1 MBL fold metallo-hydrolase [Motilibacter aurantiacus]